MVLLVPFLRFELRSREAAVFETAVYTVPPEGLVLHSPLRIRTETVPGLSRFSLPVGVEGRDVLYHKSLIFNQSAKYSSASI